MVSRMGQNSKFLKVSGTYVKWPLLLASELFRMMRAKQGRHLNFGFATVTGSEAKGKGPHYMRGGIERRNVLQRNLLLCITFQEHLFLLRDNLLGKKRISNQNCLKVQCIPISRVVLHSVKMFCLSSKIRSIPCRNMSFENSFTRSCSSISACEINRNCTFVLLSWIMA